MLIIKKIRISYSLANKSLPEEGGCVQAITSKSSKYKSLKNSDPFQPPKITIFDPPTRLAEWPKRAEGDPLPSGP